LERSRIAVDHACCLNRGLTSTPLLLVLLLLLLNCHQVSYKIFLVKTRCRGARTPTREEAETCGEHGVDFLGNEWLVEDFRRGVAHGWSQVSASD